MKKILLLSFISLCSFNASADYKIYGSQKNAIPIPKERPLYEQKISFESGESHGNVTFSGYLSTRTQITLAGREVLPTDGERLGAPYNSGGQFKPFYSYITFSVPDYVESFNLTFNYKGLGGSANNIPVTEFKVQQAKYESSSFYTRNTLNSFSTYNWNTFNDDIINNQHRYRIEARVGHDTIKYGSPVYIGIDNIIIKEIKQN